MVHLLSQPAPACHWASFILQAPLSIKGHDRVPHRAPGGGEEEEAGVDPVCSKSSHSGGGSTSCAESSAACEVLRAGVSGHQLSLTWWKDGVRGRLRRGGVM